MRLSIDKEQFLKGLAVASKAIAGKSPDPLLSNLKLDLNDKGLEITGTNKEITIKALVPYRVGDKEIIRAYGMGSTLINAKLLTEEVRLMEGNEISLEVIDEAIAKIDDGRSSIRLNCIKAREYTDIDLEPTGVILTLPTADLSQLIEQTAYATSNKDQRPLLTAVNLEAANGVLTGLATDSSRLSKKTIAIDSDARFVCNVPAKTLVDVSRLFEGVERVTLAVSDSSILFLFENTVVCSRLLSGVFPVSRTVVPQTFNYTLEVNAQELLSAMSRASLLSAEHDSVVKLSMSEEEVIVSARSEQTGSALESIRTFQFTGEHLDVFFNSLYVIDAIKVLKCEDVRLRFQAEMRPFVIQNPKDDSVVGLVTPMHSY